MSSLLANRLILARRSQFVGRTFERELFRAALAEPQLPFNIFYIFGPGGVGKTSLVQEYNYICMDMGISAVYLDGRDLEPSPNTFLGVLALNLGLSPTESPIHFLAHQSRRHVIFLDTFEQQAPLEHWLRQEFLPQLPDYVLVVLAGQNPPAIAWRTDPGWLSIFRVLPLRNLNPDEGREYLVKRNVPTREHQAILDFTYSYPLALSLVAEVFAQREDMHFETIVASDVVRSLLDRLVQKVPGPAHRAALEACAMIRVTTESLLAAMLALPDAYELFEWLRGLSFINANREGLFPHDLVRVALSSDLRWRNPDWYSELHRRARDYFTDRLQHTSGLDQQRVLVDYVFLHRDNPVLRPFLDWQMRDSGLWADGVHAADIPLLLDMVQRHEGDQSARLAAQWFDRQPNGILVYRNEDGKPEGFLCSVALQEVDDKDIALDPAVQVILRYVATHAPLRPGEKGTFFRYWMAAESYQSVSSVQSLIFISILQHYLTTPGLAITFFPAADPDFWTILLAYANVFRLPETDFVVGENKYGTYFHDLARRNTRGMAGLDGRARNCSRYANAQTDAVT